MIRPTRVLPVLLLAPLLLTACGSEKADADPAAGPSASVTEAADQGELDARAQALGVAPELVYVTGAPGFTLAQQSVGVLGGDGFSATWVSHETGAHLRLSVDRGSITAAGCPEQPVGVCPASATMRARRRRLVAAPAPDDASTPCPEGHVVRVSAEADAVPRDVLREAALGAHRPDASEAAALLPSAEPAPSAPVERGDLPSFGDGAPDNNVDVGG
ncbi:hypothetical protein LV779_13470 [Streptomyces thinghirensis]|nr:hypothetical protein [Streptomyces thinghirensis]